jgi:Phosphatidylinositol transfer protein
MHLKSKLPKFIAMLVPDSMTDIVEYSWNAFPHCRTEYYNAYYGDKFMLSVESIHAADRGTQANAVNLSPEDLDKRKVDYINIACADSHVKMIDGEDPTTFMSRKTGRGYLKPSFIEDHDPVMCCYKVVKLRFKVFALQSKVESWGQQYGIRNPFLLAHRKVFCWMDEWFGLTIDDVKITGEKLAESRRQVDQPSSVKS